MIINGASFTRVT